MAEQTVIAATPATPSVSELMTEDHYITDSSTTSTIKHSLTITDVDTNQKLSKTCDEETAAKTDISTRAGETAETTAPDSQTVDFLLAEKAAMKTSNRQAYRQHYHSLWPQIVEDTKSNASRSSPSTTESYHKRHASDTDARSSTISASRQHFSTSPPTAAEVVSSPPLSSSAISKSSSSLKKSNDDFILDICKCTSIESLNNTEHYFNHDSKGNSAAYFNASFRSAGLASYYESFPEGYILCDDAAWHNSQQPSSSGNNNNTLPVVDEQPTSPSSNLALPYTKLIYAMGLANLALFALTVAQLTSVMLNATTNSTTRATSALLLACGIVMLVCLLMEIFIALALTMLARGTSLFLTTDDDVPADLGQAKSSAATSVLGNSIPSIDPPPPKPLMKKNKLRCFWHWFCQTGVLTDFVFGTSFLVSALLIAACFTSTTLVSSYRT